MFVKGENKGRSKGRTSEEILAARAKREEIIQNALDNGALLHKMKNWLSDEERETHIRLDFITGLAFVDSSIPSDITKFINKGWKITSVTRSASNNSIQAMTFVGSANKFTIRSVSSETDDNATDDTDLIDAADTDE